jgi:hypothetical protein
VSENAIGDLIKALREHGAPDFAWIVEWSAGGEDPVTAAWNKSEYPIAMTDFILWLDMARGIDAAIAVASLVYDGDLNLERLRMWRGRSGRDIAADANLFRTDTRQLALFHAFYAASDFQSGNMAYARSGARNAVRIATDEIGDWIPVCDALRASAAPTLADVLAVDP